MWGVCRSYDAIFFIFMAMGEICDLRVFILF